MPPRVECLRGGRGVTIASVDSFGGRSGRANYVATKFGIVGLTKTLAVEWGRFGIRTHTVAPGPTPLYYEALFLNGI